MHVNHGPQPDGEALDASWNVELDKFLNNEENNLKGHALYSSYPHTFVDKSFPSEEQARDLINNQ